MLAHSTTLSYDVFCSHFWSPNPRLVSLLSLDIMVAKGSRTSSQKRAGVRKILKRPAGKFNPFPAPKRGKGRAALKRPAVKKTKAWENVPYTRQAAEVDPTGLRMDRHVWKRSMVDLLKASDKEIINMLLQDGLLTSWEGKLCPRCGEGTLSKAKIDVGGVPKHRCNRFRCQVYINPHHLHPLFTDGNGSGSTSLRIQAALLLLKLNKVSHPVIHRLLGINHKSIELMEKKLCDLRKRWVEHQEKGINFGGGPKWCDVEADETTFDRKDLKALAPDKNLPIVWEQWCGLVKRGDPKSLVLKRLVPRMSEKCAPGPGAIRKVEWAPLAKTYLQDKQVILHTDAAKTLKRAVIPQNGWNPKDQIEFCLLNAPCARFWLVDVRKVPENCRESPGLAANLWGSPTWVWKFSARVQQKR